MKFHNPTAEFFVPDGVDLISALARTTHMAIGAHQDDLEIMAYNGIAECFGRTDKWFAAVTVTNGAGSSRSGIYADFTDEQMQAIRKKEQVKAAFVGEYGSMIQLDYTSSQVKDPAGDAVVEDLFKIIEAARPEVVYLHNPADKHDTHIGTLAKAIKALRRLPVEILPKKVYGCEVWRDLDWMPDDEKVVLSASAYPNVAASLVGIFDSQISGGKRYDLATAGRRLANATYFASHSSDDDTAMSFAIDLTPLVHDKNLSLAEYTVGLIEKFKDDVRAKLSKQGI